MTFESTLWRIPLTKCVSVFQIKDLLRRSKMFPLITFDQICFWCKPNFISHLLHQISWLTISWFFWCEKRTLWCLEPETCKNYLMYICNSNQSGPSILTLMQAKKKSMLNTHSECSQKEWERIEQRIATCHRILLWLVQ